MARPARAQAPGGAPVSFADGKAVLEPLGTKGCLSIRSADPRAGEMLRVLPCSSSGREADRIVVWNVGERTDKQVTVQARFAAGGTEFEATVLFAKDGKLSLLPGRDMGGVSVQADIEHAVIPCRWFDDTVYEPGEFPAGSTLQLPPENLLMGLCRGGDRMLVLAWPPGRQHLRLTRNDTADPATARFSQVHLATDGKAVHIAGMETPGIWHPVDLSAIPLETEWASNWRKPFKAQWVIHVMEGSVPTKWEVRDQKKPSFWRPGGTAPYPVWFEGDEARFHLSKPRPPKGKALLYALEGHRLTPYAFLKGALSAEERKGVLELGKSESVYSLAPSLPARVWHDACTGRARLKATLLLSGGQARDSEFLGRCAEDKALRDRAVEEHNLRYLSLIADMRTRLDQWTKQEAADARALAFLDEMKKYPPLLEETFGKRFHAELSPKEHMAFIEERERLFKEGVRQEGTEHLAELRRLLDDLNDPLSEFEGVGFHCGKVLQRWFRDAAVKAADSPVSIRCGAELRLAIREFLSVHTYETVKGRMDELR